MPYQGIYAIVNFVHGGVYIGSSIDVFRRYDGHISDLKKGIHVNTKLQRAWNKYGEDNFVLALIEEVPDRSKLFEIEQIWIDIGGYYNMARIAGPPPNQLGKPSPRKGIPLDEIRPGWCEALKAAFTEERKKELSNLRKAHPEWHANWTESSKDPDVRERAKIAANEAKRTESYRKKISEFSKAHPEYIKKANKASADARRGKPMAEERKQNISKGLRKFYQNKKDELR